MLQLSKTVIWQDAIIISLVYSLYSEFEQVINASLLFIIDMECSNTLGIDVFYYFPILNIADSGNNFTDNASCAREILLQQ